jgi:membrane protease YdiL (CAAX protease family)
VLGYLRALSPRAEFMIVVAAAFGYFIFGNLQSMVVMVLSPDLPWIPISDADLRAVVVYELVLFAVLLPFLYFRGWRLAHIGIAPSAKDTLIGVVFVFALLVIGVFVQIIVMSIFPGLWSQPGDGPFAARLTVLTVVTMSAINPFFEELFVSGYVMTTLKAHFGVSTAVNTSIALRMAYHLYQGPSGVISILPGGLIFAYWYAYTGRLWPIIVAHIILDLFPLWRYLAPTG